MENNTELKIEQKLCGVCQQPVDLSKPKKVEGKDYYHDQCFERRAEIKRQRKLVKTKFWPFLEESAKSVNDAQTFCQVANVAITQAWENKKRKSTLKSLDLIKMIDKTNAEYKRMKFLLDMFEGETVADALTLIGGMSDTISGFVKEEMTTRELKTLKSDFLE